jgi:hypothetical protein
MGIPRTTADLEVKRILAKRNRIKKRAIPKFHYPKCVRDIKNKRVYPS